MRAAVLILAVACSAFMLAAGASAQAGREIIAAVALVLSVFCGIAALYVEGARR